MPETRPITALNRKKKRRQNNSHKRVQSRKVNGLVLALPLETMIAMTEQSMPDKMQVTIKTKLVAWRSKMRL